MRSRQSGYRHGISVGDKHHLVADEPSVNRGADSWKTLWQGFRKRVLAETRVRERFTEHDPRAKAGSLEPTRQFLTHADANMAGRVCGR